MARQKLEVTITGDADGAKRAFKETDDAAAQSGKKVSKSFDDAGKSSDTFGSKMDKLGGKARDWGDDVVKGIGLGAGALAGALLVKGFMDTLDREAGQAKLGIQLGLSPEMAAAAGKVAGEVYGDAFGDSLGTVNDAVASVTKNIGGLGDMTKDEFKDITKGVLTLADVFDQDLNKTTAAAGTLIKTGLAKDGADALDILTRGLQSPANKADDLLDTFIEYSTQFRKLGLDGPTALGLLSQGLAAGARDADTVADSFKEFSIRAIDDSQLTKDAFFALGDSSGEMARMIAAGGPTAAAGLQMTLDKLLAIEDPIARNQIGVALFGTKWEDMGAAVNGLDLTTAVTQVGNVEGAMADATAATDTNAARVTEWRRGMEENLNTFIAESVIPGLDSLQSGWTDNNSAVGDFHRGLIGLGDGFRFLKDEIIDPFVGTLQTLWGWLDSVIKKIHDFDWAVQLTGPASAAISAGGGAGDFAKTIGGPLGILAEGLGFDAGGVVPGRNGEPKLAMVHAGETILPTHKMGVGAAMGSIGVAPSSSSGGGGMAPVTVVINNANTLVAQADLSRQIETAVRQAQRTGTGILA